MKKSPPTIAILIAIAMLLPLVALSETETLERTMNTNVLSTVGKLIAGLPEIWKTKARARAIARDLPVYPSEVQVPESETIFGWISDLCSFPNRRPGTAGATTAEDWIAERFREFGLEGVTLEPVPITVWTAERWSLTVDGAPVPAFFVVNTGFTGPEGVRAPLAYVGEGGAADFDRAQVKGKIVVADVPFPKLPYGALLRLTGAAFDFSDPGRDITLGSSQYLNFVRQNFIGGSSAENAPDHDVYWQSVKRGAVGILLILRDQPSNSNSHYGPYDGIMKPMPGLWIGKHDGIKLRERARAGAEATLTLTGSTAPGVMRNVWGVLPGESDEVILVTSHSDSPFVGAVEDGAGVAQVLAQAWAWAQAPAAERTRTLVFVIDSGHFYGSLGAHEFARMHPDIMKRVRVLITLEHLGAKEVKEKDGVYAETGRPAFTVMFTSRDPRIIATVMKAFDRKPAPATASIPFDFFGPAPTSDAAGYVLVSGVPVISWIGCPYYLLDEYDTLDKIEVKDLKPIAQTVAELIGIHMVMKD